MELEDLWTLWQKPQYGPLTPKQISIRLPLIIKAKIDTLGGLHPNQSMTQIITDLLMTALDGLEKSMPDSRGKKIGKDKETGKPVYEDVGLKGDYWRAVEVNLRRLEKEANVKEPYPVPRPIVIGGR